jgi:2-polyprenyl-3-methyl-5-hydroxy-6-metoxy-1,4-benzoquinol methylase
MKFKLSDILISPDDDAPLYYEASSGLWRSTDGVFTYEQKGSVPVLLPANARERHYAEHYQTDAEQFDYFEDFSDGASREDNRRLHQAIIREVAESTTVILDVGCGKAWVAGHFCKKGVDVVSMDISTVNPVKAMEKYPYDNHHGVVADVYALPFKTGVFDCIVAAEIIEHVPDPGRFIAALLRVLKPGGDLIITTPYNEKIVYYLCVHCNRPTPANAHLHSFTEKKLLALTPPEELSRSRIFTFGNKALLRLKTHILLQYLPFGLWRWIDGIANRLIRKPTRMLYKITRKIVG